ncbi:MAG: hypothetical protein EPN45_00840 [Rhizobiaceae bacterium]|nr:MAG: hypothetical protein EPN45_00840 [Rhizobiaceae bacterium]
MKDKKMVRNRFVIAVIVGLFGIALSGCVDAGGYGYGSPMRLGDVAFGNPGGYGRYHHHRSARVYHSTQRGRHIGSRRNTRLHRGTHSRGHYRHHKKQLSHN